MLIFFSSEEWKTRIRVLLRNKAFVQKMQNVPHSGFKLRVVKEEGRGGEGEGTEEGQKRPFSGSTLCGHQHLI